MRKQIIFGTAAAAALVATTASGQISSYEGFTFLTTSGDLVSQNRDGSSSFWKSTGRSDWQDLGLAGGGQSLEVYSDWRNPDQDHFAGTITTDLPIVAAGMDWQGFAQRNIYTGIQLSDGSYHIYDVSDLDNGNLVEVGVIPRLPRGSVVTDLKQKNFRFGGASRLYLLDVGNDRMLHYDWDTLTMIGAAPFGVDLGPTATMEERRRFDKMLIADGSNTGMLYQRGMGGAGLTVEADMSAWGGAVGMTTTPAPGALSVLGVAGLLAGRRRRTL